MPVFPIMYLPKMYIGMALTRLSLLQCVEFELKANYEFIYSISNYALYSCIVYF